MSRTKGREVQKKLISISPFVKNVIKDYAEYYKTTDSIIVEDSVLNYFFQGMDVSVLEILKKEMYRNDNLNNTFCELFKYASRKKPDFIPYLARLLEEIQNGSPEEISVEEDTLKKLFDTFEDTTERSENENLKNRWKIFRKSAEEYPETFHVSELFEYFADNAEYMNRYSAKKNSGSSVGSISL